MLETPADHPEPVVHVTGSADFVLGFLSGVVDWREPRESWLVTEVKMNLVPKVLHELINYGKKNAQGQIEPRPSCTCGEVMPENIKTGPQGWHYVHKMQADD